MCLAGPVGWSGCGLPSLCRNISEPMILILREIIPGAPCSSSSSILPRLPLCCFVLARMFPWKTHLNQRITHLFSPVRLARARARVYDLRSHHLMPSLRLPVCWAGWAACGRSGPAPGPGFGCSHVARKCVGMDGIGIARSKENCSEPFRSHCSSFRLSRTAGSRVGVIHSRPGLLGRRWSGRDVLCCGWCWWWWCVHTFILFVNSLRRR